MSRSQSVITYRKQRKNDLVKLKGGKCCICGFNAYNEALEFHHVDPSTKSFGLSDGNCKSFEKDFEELKKCALVCSNCHKGIEAGYLSLPKNWNFIDENVLQDIIERHSSTATICPRCGGKKYKRAQYCIDCHNELKSRGSKKPDRDTLKDLIRHNSFLSIGKMFEVTDNAIRKWCDSYDLPCRVMDIQQYSDEEWERV